MAELFGFEFKRKGVKKEEDLGSFAPKIDDEGSITVAEGGMYGTYVDLEGSTRTESELITRYRRMALQPECELAIDDIVNETIVYDELHKIVELNLDSINTSPKIKDVLREQFDEVLKLLDFGNKGYEVFRHWYIDGRLYYHVVINPKDTEGGIYELRYIDPRKIKKIRTVNKKRLGQGSAGSPGAVTIQKTKDEYFIYNEKGFTGYPGGSPTSAAGEQGVKIAKDSIVNVTSGMMSEDNRIVLSHLHKAIKPLNQLRILEDASVIYRISRAPERRIFYIDVGNLPKQKAEQYLRDMMAKHKNRLVYNAATGEVRDDRKFMTMLEDFWLPRREGGRGTEITTLPGGQNLGEMEDVVYFQKKLYRSLNVPVSRLEPETGFSLGRSAEISRDELKFQKFIGRARMRFSMLFESVLEKQLILKNIMTLDEWIEIKDRIRYDFMEDNHFTELKENEIMTERVNMLNNIDPYMGRYFSQQWARKNVLRMTDEEIQNMEKEIADEQEAGDIHPEIEPAGQQAGGEEDPDAEGGDGPPNGGTENGPPEQI
jgi:hypothetical protein